MSRALLLVLMVLVWLGLAAPVRAAWELPEWVTIQPAEDCTAGCWRLVEVEYLAEGPSQGLHHVFARTQDAQGNTIAAPFGVAWEGGSASAMSKPPPEWGDIPMWACFFPDQGEVGGYRVFGGIWEANSDVVRGLGLPYCRHESIRLTWQWNNGGETPTPTPTATAPPLPEALYLPLIRR